MWHKKMELKFLKLFFSLKTIEIFSIYLNGISIKSSKFFEIWLLYSIELMKYKKFFCIAKKL